MKSKKDRTKEAIVFLTAVGYRIFLYLVAAVILAFSIREGSLTLETFLNTWCRWDANHYLNIAANGYRGAVEFCDTCREALLAKGVSPEVMESGQHLFLVFFPLFPWVLRLVGTFLVDLRLAGLLLSTLTFAGGMVYVYRLASEELGERAAKISVLLLTLFPFGFFFGGIMSESLFLLLSAATLYYVRKHAWWRVVLFGALASLCRMQGALLIIPAGLEILFSYRPLVLLREKNGKKIREMFGRGISLLLMLSGTGIYLLVNQLVDGYALSFTVYQDSHWNQGMGLFTETLRYVFQYAFTDAYNLQTRMALWIPQAVLAIFSVAVLLAGIRKLRAAWMGYGIAYILLTYSATWLLSAGRYLSCCIPLFLVLGVRCEKRKWLLTGIALTFFALQILYLDGFLSGLQIM